MDDSEAPMPVSSAVGPARCGLHVLIKFGFGPRWPCLPIDEEFSCIPSPQLIIAVPPLRTPAIANLLR